MIATVERDVSNTVMKHRMPSITLSGLIVAVFAQLASAQTFVWTKQPVKDGNTGLVFRDMAGFKFQRATVKNDDSFQYDIDFKPPGEGRLQISVFGNDSEPEGVDSPVVKTAFYGHQMSFHFKCLFNPDVGLEVGAEEDTEVTVGDGAAAVRFLRATVTTRKGEADTVHLYYVRGYRGYLVAIDTEFPKGRQAEATRELEQFLAEFAKQFHH